MRNVTDPALFYLTIFNAAPKKPRLTGIFDVSETNEFDFSWDFFKRDYPHVLTVPATIKWLLKHLLDEKETFCAFNFSTTHIWRI